MKNNSIRLILFLISIFTLPACTDTTHKKEQLLQAETLMDAHPDSALSLLQSIGSPEKMSHKDYATWCLLKTKADDKNYIRHTSDSLINIAVDYFEKTEDKESYSTALYYKGRAKQDLDKNEEAALLFVKALDIGEKMQNKHQLFIMASRLGTLYARLGISNKALKAYNKAYQFALAAKDSSDLSYAHSYLGRVYGKKRDWGVSLDNYEKALYIAKNIHNKKAYSLALKEYTAVCMNADSVHKITKYEEEIEKYLSDIKSKEKAESYYLTLGNVYRKQNKTERAIYYLEKATQSNNLYITQGGRRALYLLYRNICQYEKAIRYNELYLAITDSIQNVGNSNAILNIEKKYNDEKVINEKIRLQLNNSKLINLILIILIASVLILAFIGKLYYKKRQDLVNLRKQLSMLENKSNSYQHHIELNRKQLILLSKQLQEKEDERSFMLKNIKETKDKEFLKEFNYKDREIENLKKEYVTLNNRNLKLSQDISEANDKISVLNRKISSDPIIFRIKQKIKYLSDKEWEELRLNVDLLFNNFSERLQDTYFNISDQELRLCILMKLQYSDEEIGTFLSIEKDSVIKRKQRLRSHLIPNKSWKKGELKALIDTF